MKLYHWKRYAGGQIVVMAESVEQARQRAQEAFHSWTISHHGLVDMRPDGTSSDQNSSDIYLWAMRQFEVDLSGEPSIDDFVAIFSGS